MFLYFPKLFTFLVENYSELKQNQHRGYWLVKNLLKIYLEVQWQYIWKIVYILM